MSSYRRGKTKFSLGRIAMIAAGIAVNCILGLITYKLNLPLYFDTIGTIGVTMIAGTFPGMVTGVVTNILCSFFNSNSLYYSMISVLVALVTSWFCSRYEKREWHFSFILIAALGVISGILGTGFQYLLLGEPQFEFISGIAEGMGSGIGSFLSAMMLNIGLNMVDKGLSVIIAIFVTHLIPERIRTGLRNSVWKQKPLSSEEKSRIGFDALKIKGGKDSLYRRIGTTLVLVAFLLTIAMGWVSIELYQKNLKKEYAENALHTANLAAMAVDAEMVDEYIEKGKAVPGYKETENWLYSIRDNSEGVKYLYVLQIREDGCHVVFDTETEDTPAYQPGDILEFEAAFEPYLPVLFAGGEIPPIESNDVSGWVLTTYCPVKDAKGHTVCYAGADVSMGYLSDYVKNFIIKSILTFSGLFFLIIGYGIWLSEYFLVFPIRSMTDSTKDYAQSGDDQERLDHKVRVIKELDIRTNDELEDLYEAISRMSVEMAEQVRSIRRYADTNAQMQNGLITTMADMVESRDSDTGAHTQKTAEYVKIIVEGLRKKGYYSGKITDKFISDVVMSAPLHDIGKISVSDTILNKPGRLTDEEFEIMKTHTTEGKALIDKAISTVQGESYLREARYMAACHHERFDGKGYPMGLYGEEIPLSARIMAVADVFDALTSKRVYKPAFSLEQSVRILKEGSGTQFDPKCIEVFIENLDQAVKVMIKYQDPDQ